jgi:HEAT repeat protein
VRLAHALAIPETSDETLRTAIAVLEHADDPKRRALGLEQLVTYCDLAFRKGRHDDLVVGLAALLAIEFAQLEADASDERRQAFNHAVRRLARPVLLRQLAVLRHSRAEDLTAVERIQQALFRFGIDGAEAVLDACATAPDAVALSACLESLRGLPRAHEALRTQVTDPNELVVRQAIAILGALRDPMSEIALDGLLEHPDPRTRRDAVAALARFDGAEAFESVAFALADESPLVRVRAVTGLAARRDPRLLTLFEPLIKAERDREVLYAAVDALGKLGTPEAVQALIAIAQGQGTNPQRDAAGLRIQACIALVAIRTPQSMAAVQLLRDDRDREVRQASMRLVAHAKRRPTTQVNAVIAP